MIFPWTDWQFWLVSGIALWCAWLVVRQLLPRSDSSACGACASGTAACAKHTRQGAAAEPPLVVLGKRSDAGLG